MLIHVLLLLQRNSSRTWCWSVLRELLSACFPCLDGPIIQQQSDNIAYHAHYHMIMLTNQSLNWDPSIVNNSNMSKTHTHTISKLNWPFQTFFIDHDIEIV